MWQTDYNLPGSNRSISMLIFTLELIPASVEQGLTGLSRGHLSIQGSHSSVTSKDRVPDQSMMIFISIVELLDGLRRFFSDTRSKSYKFIGADCSFQFTVKRVKENQFTLISDGQEIDTVTQTEIVQAIWKGVKSFLDCYQNQIDSTDTVANDLSSAVAEFREFFI